MEEWVEIEEFPDYLISDTGLVMNENTGRILAQSYNPQGAKKVGLFHFNKQHARSVKYLVAQAFVPGRTEQDNTAVLLDGDQENCNAENIVWRPRWFANKYSTQFENVGDWYLGKQVMDVESGVVYEDILDAALTNGLLLYQILDSIHNEQARAYPDRRKFTFC